MALNERDHLERLAEVYAGNIHQLEMQVAMAGGIYNVELYLRNNLEQQRTALAELQQRLAQYTETLHVYAPENTDTYLQGPALNKRERKMLILLLSLLDYSDG